MGWLINQDEIQRQEEEWEPQSVVRTGLSYDDVPDVQRAVLLGDST